MSLLALPPLTPPRRILLVKPSALGDVVHALPVAALLKRRWPESRLSWLVARPFAPLLETNPHVDETIPFDRGRGESFRRHSGQATRLARTLRGGNFDLAIDLQGLLRSGWLTWQTRAARRVGFAAAREGSPLFYTDRVPSRPGERHAVERYLDVAEHLGCGRSPVMFDLPTTDADERAVDVLLEPLAGRPFAALLPGTNWVTKRWPASHFAELATRLPNETGLAVVIAGGPDAADAARAIRQAAPDALNLTGRTAVRELVALLRRASLAITNDSGPMHIAAALGRPLVSTFGPTNPHRTGPYERGRSVVRLDVVCSPCYERACIHQTCLAALPVEQVLRRCVDELASGV